MDDDALIRQRLGLASRCFVCGSDNPRGLRVSFNREADGRVSASFTADENLAGYKGVLHGGIVAALLDEVMIKAVFAGGAVVVTAEMTVRYHKPVPTLVPLRLEGRATVERRRIVEAEGSLSDGRGIVLASAAGRYVRVEGAVRERLMRTLREST